MDLLTALKTVLRDVSLFAEHLSGVRLREYQKQVAEAIAASVLTHAGRSFVVIFPRQSGKNELQAQIETYLLALLQDRDAEIVKISPTWKPQSLNAMRRLERILKKNMITRDKWIKEQGYIYRVGAARIYFLSGEPSANIVGATASTLLEVDEAQDVLPARYDKDINPMAASANATRVFWGTAWTSATLLAREKRAALAAQAADGCRRVFELSADTVRTEAPAYGQFVDGEVAKLGRNHPLIKTQFFSEEIDSQSGLFTPERLALIRGDHAPQLAPAPGGLYVFCIDVGGEEVGRPVFGGASQEDAGVSSDITTGPLGHHASVAGVKIGYAETVHIHTAAAGAAGHLNSELGLPHSEHDATVLTIFEIDLATLADPGLQAPTFKVVQRQAWTGAGQPQLYARLNALTNLWLPQRIVIDATGLGEGLAAFLERSHPGQVTRFKFSQSSKSTLGWNFIAILESGRYKEHTSNSELQTPHSELQALFFAQAAACTLEILPGPARTLRYSVPACARHPLTGQPLHDDLVLSAMLCAALYDEPWGAAESTVIRPTEPALTW